MSDLDFTAEDIECLSWVFSICKINMEYQYMDAGEPLPDYVIDELFGLRDRLIRLLRKRVSQ